MIEEELGCGAMGSVYRATWNQEGRPSREVALKQVALGLLGNESAMARFEREANILKQLRHPHIVKLLATGNHRKSPFIVMEYIAGEPLDRALVRRGRLGWEEVATYGKQLCAALQYAHEKGIIHRDLKPSNLMINREGLLKLTDFGIAKDTDVTALTSQNSTIGTASYMSPEQCKGDRNLTYKSDLYSLGVVFFELLSGKKPFYAEDTVGMFVKHVNEPPPRIGKMVHDLPAKFEALIMQLLEKDKEDRPVDAAWVTRLLTEIEEDAIARKSAGVDLATSKRANKPRNLDGSQLDESDRDAARALRGKRKKSRKKFVPILERKWVRATGICAALALLIGGAYLALRPPSAEKLATAIDVAASPESRVEAASKYLEHYGTEQDDRTTRAAAVYREEKVLERDRQLTNRFARKMNKPEPNDDPEAYESAWKAVEAEKAGALALAAEWWRKVKGRFPEEAALAYALKEDVLLKARWGWLADKRLSDLEKVRQVDLALKTKIHDSNVFEIPASADPTSLEGLAIKGYRLENFGDREKAIRTCWDQIIALTEKEADKREWHLLASEHRSLGKPADDPSALRLKLIRDKVKKAGEIAEKVKSDPGQKVQRSAVRETCRDVIDLYGDESQDAIQAQVKSAREIMPKVPK